MFLLWYCSNNPDWLLLLQQMQRTTSLLEERLSSSAGSGSSVGMTSTSFSTETCAVAPSSSAATSMLYSSSLSHAPFSTTSVPHYPHALSATRRFSLPTGSYSTQSRHVNHGRSTSEHLSSFSSLSTQRMTEDETQANLARLFRNRSTPLGSRGKSVKRKKNFTWMHTFVCLPEPDALYVPNPEENRFYEACGIGKKDIHFDNNVGDHAYLSEHLYNNFPPLRHAGGYTLAKSDRGKRLVRIPIPPLGYTIEFLRHDVDIKRAPLYIIPLQRGLTLNAPIERVYKKILLQ